MICPGADKVFVPSGRLTYSIIIPVYNKWALTGACLDALGTTIAHRRDEGEIIVVDDASTDETATALAARGDVDLVVRHEQNTGFQGAATDGAAAARGDVIVFLNNDTLPQAGWLDALLEQLNEPGVGIAGSMFLFPDGRVQEFGGIVWRDAGAYHIGAGLDPEQPLFSKPRDVDYVSGAGLAIAKTFWNEIGGFDPELKPAYYEDTDLCMKARAAGKRVVVTPRSRIVHIMGGSKDVDPRRSHDTMMAANRQKFHAKWKAVLDREHWPAHRYFLDAASERAQQVQTAPPPLDPNGKRLLFVYAIPPQFDRQSGDRRLFEMMRAYRAAGHAVTLLAFTSDPAQAQLLERAGITVWHGDSRQMLGEGVADTLEERMRNECFDFVYLGSPQVARMYLGFIRHVLPHVPVITDAIDLNFHRMHRDRLINHPPASVVSLPLDRQWELETYAASDALTSVSEDEAAILRASGITSPIEIVGNFYSEAIEPEPFAQRLGLVIVVNMAHHPNLDALRWFLSEIWPRALRLKPDLQLTICGNGTEALKVDGVPNIAITGYLPSMNPVFRNARVNVAPLRVGAGVKGKVTEAMRNGLPTVTTPIGAEGLGADSREALLVESDPERFAQALVALHEDEALWTRISQTGTAFARSRLSPEAFKPILERLLNTGWRAHHSEQMPSIAEIDAAFSEPDVGIATFAAGGHRDALVSLLRAEPSIAAIVGAEGTPRVAFAAPQSVPALVLSRAAYQCAMMRGACSSVSQLLLRAQEHALVLGCVPELPHAVWDEERVAPLTVDITVPACAEPQRIAAIVQGVKAAANCRLRIVPAGDLSPALPAEVIASADVDGPADVRIFDGPLAMPNVLGLFNPVGARQTIALDPAAGVDSEMLGAHVRRWAAHRWTIVADISSAQDVWSYMKALIKPLEHGPCRTLLIAHDARHVQMAWSCGMPVTRYFSGLPQRTSGAAYLCAATPWAMERIVEEEKQDAVVDGQQKILAARIGPDVHGQFSTREELFDFVTPEWLRPMMAPKGTMRSRGMRTVVFVLGMHRSGTSLTTAILHTAGVRLSEDLMAPNEFNRMGYFESTSIAEIHDGILAALGSSWMSSTIIKPFPERWWKRPEIAPFKQRLMEIVERELDAGDYVWGFKDPRTARLLPLWNEIIEELHLDARFVLSIRDPREVARSLHAREQLSEELSELLWLEHNAAVLEALGEKLHAVASYERWFTDPEGQAQEMLSALGLEMPAQQDLKTALKQIVAEELRHHQKLLGAFALPYSGELYQALFDGNRASAQTLAELFAVNCAFTSRMLALERAEIAGTLHNAHNALQQRDAAIAELRSELAVMRAQVPASGR